MLQITEAFGYLTLADGVEVDLMGEQIVVGTGTILPASALREVETSHGGVISLCEDGGCDDDANVVLKFADGTEKCCLTPKEVMEALSL